MRGIKNKFSESSSAERKVFIPFVTAGDPDLETSFEIVMALTECGADIIELGVPFSDPMADGPTIQASSQRALLNGTTLCDVLELVRQIRQRSDVPIVLFSYLNPLFRYGLDKLAIDAAKVGVDGVLVTDAIDDEAKVISAILRSRDLDLISLIAPTTSDERLRTITASASGFIYAISRAGVTGARAETSNAAEVLVGRARKLTDLPIAVGFGISTRTQIENVWKYADAAVVGSAIVAEIDRSISTGNVVDNVKTFVTMLVPAVAKDAVDI